MAAHLPPVQLRFELSTLVRASVASLFSNLVTRPTGQAIRLGIEAQILELGQSCLSVLDFSEVVVLDFSCADEAVAKLVRRYQLDPAAKEVYFLARGLGAVHRETLEAVLLRHGLALPVQFDCHEVALLGGVSPAERASWSALERAGSASPPELASSLAAPCQDVELCLRQLQRRRLILEEPGNHRFRALSSLLRDC